MSLYDDITNKIISEIESGTMPWLQPWKSGGKGDGVLPFNAATGRVYNGINTLVLWIEGEKYKSNGWVTYNQAKKLGGNVKKGEKSTQVVFWKFSKIKDEETGEEKTIPFARGYNVFNLDQCEGIEYDQEEVEIQQCQALALAKNNHVNLHHGGDKACFMPSLDIIKMPQQSQFESIEHYNATLDHELVHWSGGKDRLDREFGKRFGDNAYAMEELVAEIGAAFLCAQQGIEGKLQHADYVATWLKVLKADKRAIFTAASKAQKAAEFLLEADVMEDTQEAA